MGIGDWAHPQSPIPIFIKEINSYLENLNLVKINNLILKLMHISSKTLFISYLIFNYFIPVEQLYFHQRIFLGNLYSPYQVIPINKLFFPLLH